MPDISKLQKNIGITFRQPILLSAALVHSSYINENPDAGMTSNERLEFLGDAVLDLVVADTLYRDYPDLAEGQMTKLRASLVRKETLARMAEVIKLGDYLLMGKGEASGGGRQKPANTASAFEAVIAAVFLDGGLSAASDFILRNLEPELSGLTGHSTEEDYKSALQELTQSRAKITPSYSLTSRTGPDHRRTFTVEVTLNGEVLGKGTGKSKKAAETEAAREALEHLPSDFTG